ncbi:MAG: sigma-70 family RNA polymerase sigma factor [Planctomycetes bacterium]|nr:sigma-70 family RNA polymerase sigma factor [Planctomycetota bacterium]
MASPQKGRGCTELWSLPNRQPTVELLRDPDADLVAACRQPDSAGFEAAFEELFLKYRDRVHAIAFRMTGSSADALDIVQDSFALVFRKLQTFRGGSLFSTWLFRIVVNRSIDQRRRAVSRPLLDLEQLNGDEPVDVGQSPRDYAATRELGDQVQQAVSLLSPKLRAILALRYLEDMSYEELAATLGLSLGTVKSRLARAHLALENLVRTRFPHLDLSGNPSDAAPHSSGGAG